MIKQLSVIALLSLMFAFNAYAGEEQQKEKVVTGKWSFVMGNAKVANHYLSDQEYKGTVVGLSMDFGSFYKKSDKLSWDVDVTYFLAPYIDVLEISTLANPSKTSYYALHSLRADYGTYYNWNPVKNLNIKAGGKFDILGGFTMAKPNHVNNIMDLDFQAQLKAAAGIRYGWNFKKWGIFLQADVAVPFMGLALGGNTYQNSFDGIGNSELLPGSIKICHLTSFHNLTGFNAEFELDFVFGKTTLFLSSEYNNRWWHFNGIQNYRLYNLSKIGLMVDLVARNRHNSNNRYF